MLTIFIIGAASVMFYRIAETEGENALLWGTITVLMMLISITIIPIPFFNCFIGAIATFALMIGQKMYRSR